MNDEKSIFPILKNYQEFMKINNNGIISTNDKLFKINGFINAVNLGIVKIIQIKNVLIIKYLKKLILLLIKILNQKLIIFMII